LYVANGNGTTLIRVRNPTILADKLEELFLYLRSDKIFDTFQTMREISDKIACGEDVILDNVFFDKEAFEKHILINEVMKK
jgi:hypothetical protein